MGKGIKSLKIEYGELLNVSTPANNHFTLKADELAHITVGEWAPGINGLYQGNVNWFRYDNKKELLANDYGNRLNFSIPKNHCGSYTHYIEASLSENCDFTNGIYINGHCDPLITYSKWCIQNDGSDQRDHDFSFGENVFLSLNTEGINGNWVTVELYRLNDDITIEKIKKWLTDKNYDPKEDDKLAKIFDKQAWVINGEINTDFTILPTWKKGEDGNKFYVKIKDNSQYIRDNNHDYIHARFLRVKNKTVPIQTKIEILTSNSPVKIGDTEKKVDNISKCRFRVINFTERGGTVELFNEGKFINKMDASSKFYTIKNIN
ncbi:hypothetical protein FNJ88_07110 [Chryseobacterium sp. SNU WT5]|uniref:hypothetical protein n=1 Tax=Chryseobacterium sp. SNU WT5 TaxID=2594269 RepID=UPI00117C6924|nr:hypothetical protein [Chryseobacterium sp. SNU WT5]QDP85343.1 hypothetical protein FNJ88_07110 [Chryseobacterium sp. SNU WT5]